MRKIIPLLIVGTLVLSALAAVAVPQAEDALETNEILSLSALKITDADEYLRITLDKQTSLLLDTGKPVVPVISKVYTFPLGTKVHDVSVEFSNIETHQLTKKIIPAPQPVPLNVDIQTEVPVVEDTTVYTSDVLYPATDYIVEKGAGLEDGVNVMYLVVRCYPVRYLPVENTVYAAKELDISITYDLPASQPVFAEEHDILIITPQKYVSLMDPLVEHKEANGMSVIVKTTEEIYSEYSEGRDEPEKIKLCIYDMKNTYNISYVILGGGRKGQTFKWIVPERRTNNDDGWEGGFASDLYYADIYKLEEDQVVFEDWDSNGNDIFAEYKGFQKDEMDFYPDVMIGRLTFRYQFEARTAVEKIIAYETTASDSWFKKAVLIAGDTFPAGDNAYEGELETEIAYNWLVSVGFDVEKLWTSLGTFTGTDDVINALKPGVGFAYFAGHGNPMSWSTHPPHEKKWVDGLKLKDISKLRNGDKLPMVVVGGCHNSQFNTTLMNIIRGIIEYGLLDYFGVGEDSSFRFYYNEWSPRDWSSGFLLCNNGGGIGAIGMSSLGYGYQGYYTTEGLGGWLDPRFFDAYVNNSQEYIGGAHCQAISDYITYIGRVNVDNVDRKTITAWTLIGDPSVKLGGL